MPVRVRPITRIATPEHLFRRFQRGTPGGEGSSKGLVHLGFRGKVLRQRNGAGSQRRARPTLICSQRINSEQTQYGTVHLVEGNTFGAIALCPAKSAVKRLGCGQIGNAEGDQRSLEVSLGNLININTATQEELDTLPGIGSVRANAIIVYRTENGFFMTIEDLLKVEGIGETTFNELKEFITVTP